MFDFRFVAAPQLTRMLEQSTDVKTSPISVMLRSAVQLNRQHRVSYTMGLEGTLLSPTSTAGASAKVVVPRAMYEYRPKEGIELAVGRDLLPTGIGLPEPQTFMRNGVDSRDSRYPTQVKAFLWSKRLQITPYVFGPGGDEVRAARQYGGGVVGGVDVWNNRAVVGLTTRMSSSETIDRRSVGAFARLGFGKWGILAEHDLTSRAAITETIIDPITTPETRHLAGHTQVFFAPKEWLVTSLAAEHLVIEGLTNPVHTYRFTPAVQTRLSDSLTLIFNMRDVFVDASTARSRTFTVQVAVKSIQ